MKYRSYLVVFCFAIAGAFISWFYIPTDFRVWITAVCLAVSLLSFHLFLWKKPSQTASSGLPYGWLVSISGDMAGTEYRLYEGDNFLVADIKGNLKVADAGQIYYLDYGTIVFDGQTHEALLLPPNQDLVKVYLNDSRLICEPKKLHIYDVIRCGRRRYIFIPLFCHRFQWA